MGDDTVSVIDTATHAVTTTIEVGDQPQGVAITPDGTRAYITKQDRGTVSVIDTATNTVATTPIPVGLMPWGAAITPDGTRAYITNQYSDTVSVIGIGIETPSTSWGSFAGSRRNPGNSSVATVS
ncbi:YncE family protein [Rhodococcus marinonascens]|uniref:YncE family protein n=1 Tax=Rhodococcus marinonascens TaxID=38311 RepID=UPI0009336089|nr:hypothetical protein [Rhodococcus marinonascens]